MRKCIEKKVVLSDNQEDSLLMNKSAVQKGLFRAQALKKYYEVIKRNSQASQVGVFMKPEANKVEGMKNTNYDKLTEKGYPEIETVIEDGDVIIGMVNPKANATERERSYKDNSTLYKSIIPGAVDKVIPGTNAEGYDFLKLRIRSERKPNVGDKFSSRAGQKGTIGYLPPRIDMPFSFKSELVPDIIINPNCIPKRMTIGQLVECILGKVCAIKCVYGDATPFMGVDVAEINRQLVAEGWEPWGNEIMYNGMTGQKMEVPIFIGPVYYQRLKQMVGDKIHSRAAGGSNQMLTRQPPEGRSKEGGLRLGEMEQNGLVAHGTMKFLKERMVDCSDTYIHQVCDICGKGCFRVPKKNHYMCKHCKNTTQISPVVIPYCFKLLEQELESVGISMRIKTSKYQNQ
jgi:DNA-directed RNA polymerase II subunit RPB2